MITVDMNQLVWFREARMTTMSCGYENHIQCSFMGICPRSSCFLKPKQVFQRFDFANR